ncbi:MAG: ATP-binding protein [Spirochaetales bacterium]|nr:ATP-binding protein [Spirochaetales bacterium]
MDNLTKGINPFYPGQPVPVEYFTGRMKEIERITRAIGQVENGKPQAVFLTGEYGIGKSSLAGFLNFFAEKNNHLIGIHVFLGGAETLDDLAEKTVEAVLRQQIYEESRVEKIRNFLAKYIGQQSLFGVNVNFQAVKADAPNIAKGFLPFLNELLGRLKDDGVKGLMLILDEINGITRNKQFSHFVKSLVDENAVAQKPLPLLLMLCGVEERRRDMIGHHPPVERIFDIIEINPMEDAETETFFEKSFSSIGLKVEDRAMYLMRFYSAGFPKLMHIIGDKVFWENKDGVIDEKDVRAGIVEAAIDVGSKFIDQQVYKALKSNLYKSIFKKLAQSHFDLSFTKAEIEKTLDASEKKNFSNFLQRAKKLGLLVSGEEKGEYIFTSRLARLYINFAADFKWK